MNETIEERALINFAYEYYFCGYNLSKDMVCRAYIKGAKDQKEIDDEVKYRQGYQDAIDDICKILRKRNILINDSIIKEFRNVMEE